MKILFISHHFYPSIGGIEVISELLAKYFTNAGHEVHVLTTTLHEGESHFPFAVIRNPSISILFREHAWADVIMENNPSIRLTWPVLLLRKPVVTALHTWISRPDGSVGVQDRIKNNLWLKVPKKVIAVSNALRKKMWPDATVIINPYRVNIFNINKEVKKSTDFLFLGRLVSDKGIHLAIQAIKQLDKYKGLNRFLTEAPKLTIVGDGPEKENLIQLTKKLELDKQVHFAGILRDEELADCINEHRFLLVPSIWEEPFGVVAVEAIACGCIPIVSDSGGLPEAVGEAGLVFKPTDVSSLVACIDLVLANPDLEIQLLAAAENHLSQFHSDTVARKYLSIIEESASS